MAASSPMATIAAMNYGLNAVPDQIYNMGNMPAWGLWNVYEAGYALKSAYYAWQIMAGHIPPAATVYGHTCDRNQFAEEFSLQPAIRSRK